MKDVAVSGRSSTTGLTCVELKSRCMPKRSLTNHIYYVMFQISHDSCKDIGTNSSTVHNNENIESRTVNGLNSQLMDNSSAPPSFTYTVALASDIHDLLQNVPDSDTSFKFRLLYHSILFLIKKIGFHIFFLRFLSLWLI